MNLIKTNNHLNIFNYYGVSDDHNPKENNLSRALAIALSNDRRLLNKVFKKFVLDDVYSELFSLDYDLIEDEEIYIDIQTSARSTKNIERKYGQYIGVLLSNFDGNFSSKEIAEIEPASTSNPIPDILIGIRDTLIVIETKLCRSSINNFSQLKGHVEAIIANNNEDDQKVEKIYKSTSWSSILREAMELYDNESNVFINDFIDFVRRNYTKLMPVIPLQDINIEAVDTKGKKEDHQYKMIKQRLEVIKTIMTQECFKKEELLDKGKRSAIPIGFGWASEANLYFDEDSKSIKLKIWPADTKGQGKKIYKEDKQIDWIEREKIRVDDYDYKMKVTPYIKFANWNTGVGYIKNTLNQDNKYEDTHCYDTFKKIAGRWKRTGDNKNWSELEVKLDDIIGKEWRSDVAWSENFINSGKTTIDLSFGIEIEITIPYSRAQKLDIDKDNRTLAQDVYTILESLKIMIDKK